MGLAVTVAILMVGSAISAAALIGPFTYVTTHGTSMEPPYQGGDFIVLRRVDTYQAGDIAAYYSSQRQRIILHRIVAEHHQTFTSSGDNNPYVDPERIHADDLLGAAWLRLPKLHIPALGLALPPQ